jgi:agmatinase
VAVIGVPFDTATSFRPGARFGPEAIRSGSTLLRPYHPVLNVDVFATISAVDGGDLEITPGNARRTAEQINAGLRPLLEAGIVPLVLGGDHSIVLGTPFRRAVEEGLLAPERSLLAGMRGPLYGAEDADQPRGMGFEVIDGEEMQRMTPADYGRRVRERIGDGPVFMSFDIDVLDPAFAPGTGTPEVNGMMPREALGFLRALAGIEFTGFDLVEVSPAYDNAGQVTALHAAAVAYEMLALVALTRQ